MGTERDWTTDDELTLYTYPEASEILKLPSRWLQRNIKKLPHHRPGNGRYVRFTRSDLARIAAMGKSDPTPAAESALPGPVVIPRPLPKRQRSSA